MKYFSLELKMQSCHSPVNLFHRTDDDVDGQKFSQLIGDIEWRIEHTVPNDSGQYDAVHGPHR